MGAAHLPHGPDNDKNNIQAAFPDLDLPTALDAIVSGKCREEPGMA